MLLALALTAGCADAPAPGATATEASVARPASTPAPLVDPEVAFWRARVERDKDDHISPTKLGYACLTQARKSGDFSFFAQAEQAFTTALTRSPGHHSAMLGLARTRAARHRFHDAIDLARKVAAARPTEVDAFAILGDAYLGLGDLDAADGTYKEVAARAPGFVTDSRRANLMHARGRSREAIELLRSALADATARDQSIESRTWAQVMIGASLFDLGDWAAAEPEYLAALKLSPNDYVAIEHLAELRAYQRREQEALALYDRAIALAGHPDFFEAVAQIHEWGGRPAEARKWYARARDGYLAAVKAGDPGYYRHLAMYYVDVERKPAEAVSWARKDLELRQDHAAWSTLAWALHAKGDIAGALEANAKGTASGAQDAGMWFRAGVIEKAARNTTAARAAFERALAINVRFDRADEARTLLAEVIGHR